MSERDELPGAIDPTLMAALTELALEAGAIILKARAAGVVARTKADQTPVTTADEAAEAAILEGLGRILPGVVIVSEEQVAAAPPLPDTFLLVDPLDGTREFLAGSDEFTVNIALVADRRPVLGVVGAPALGMIWRGAPGRGADRLRAGDPTIAEPIRTRPWPTHAPHALVSRSHGDPATAALLQRLGATAEPTGSALKFCRLAEGRADLYPRLAPTCEWDIAAGHALLAAAGGTMLSPDGLALVYGQREKDFRVPAFIACGDPEAYRHLS